MLPPINPKSYDLYFYIGIVAVLFCWKFYSSKRQLIADIRKDEVRQQKLYNIAEVEGQ